MDPRNNIATDLFYKIRSRFSGLKLGSETGQITIIPEEARFFDFDYTQGDAAIGHVSISLAEANSMKVYFSAGITESMDTPQKDKWYGFLKELRLFAKKRLMSFDTRDIAKDNLDKRDYQFLSQANKPATQPQVGESVMNESTMYGSRTMSYQKLMDTRLIIKHSQAVMDDTQPGARTRHISALFVENQDGERFKYPFIHLAGARAMQRHVANGGLPYDEIGESIINMSEEIAQLKSFSNYVVRNDLMNSDNNEIVEKGQTQLNNLRETIAKLSKQSHYNSYKESFKARENYDIPEDIAEDFVDKFTVKNFKEDIKSVFPVLYRLMKEQEQELGYNDIVENGLDINTDEDEIKEYDDPMASFEQWAMSLGEESGITSEDVETQQQAIKELQALVGEHFPAGVDGTNAIESLKGIIEDPQLYKEIKEAAKQDPDTCVRGLVKDWLEQNAPEVVEDLDFGDFVEEPAAAQGGEETAPEEEPQMADLDQEQQSKKLSVKELAEFIHSFYDKDSGTFPKGPEGVCTMVGKKFGEQAERVARMFVERMAPHQEHGAEELEELSRMRELAGVQAPAQEQISNEAKIDWNSDDVKEVEAMYQKFYVKDTPEGKLLLGDDVEGYFYADQDGGEREGHITFVYNMDTGKFLEYPEDYSDFYGYLSDRDVKEFVNDVVREIEDKIGPDDGPKEPKNPQAKDYAEEDSVSESQDGTFHVDTKKEPMIDVKVKDYHYDSYAEDIIIELENAETGEPIDINDVTSGRAEIENWVQQQMEKERDDRDYSEDSSEELDRIRKLSGIAQGLGY